MKEIGGKIIYIFRKIECLFREFFQIFLGYLGLYREIIEV